MKTIKKIVFDIAGTLSSLDFIKSTLLQYAIDNAEQFLNENWNDESLQANLKDFQTQCEKDKDLNKTDLIELVVTKTKENSNLPALKTIQGLIYSKGYESDNLKAHIFDDVKDALETLSKSYQISTYSTGSELAQKLMFKNTIVGDLSEHISNYFDQVDVGAKDSCESYKNLANKLDVTIEEFVFITDLVSEAEASLKAGVTTYVIKRDGNKKLSEDEEKQYNVISSLKNVVDLLETNENKRKLELSADDDNEVERPQKLAKTETTSELPSDKGVQVNLSNKETANAHTQSIQTDTKNKATTTEERMDVDLETIKDEVDNFLMESETLKDSILNMLNEKKKDVKSSEVEQEANDKIEVTGNDEQDKKMDITNDDKIEKTTTVVEKTEMTNGETEFCKVDIAEKQEISTEDVDNEEKEDPLMMQTEASSNDQTIIKTVDKKTEILNDDEAEKKTEILINNCDKKVGEKIDEDLSDEGTKAEVVEKEKISEEVKLNDVENLSKNNKVGEDQIDIEKKSEVAKDENKKVETNENDAKNEKLLDVVNNEMTNDKIETNEKQLTNEKNELDVNVETNEKQMTNEKNELEKLDVNVDKIETNEKQMTKEKNELEKLDDNVETNEKQMSDEKQMTNEKNELEKLDVNVDKIDEKQMTNEKMLDDKNEKPMTDDKNKLDVNVDKIDETNEKMLDGKNEKQMTDDKIETNEISTTDETVKEDVKSDMKTNDVEVMNNGIVEENHGLKNNKNEKLDNVEQQQHNGIVNGSKSEATSDGTTENKLDNLKANGLDTTGDDLKNGETPKDETPNGDEIKMKSVAETTSQEPTQMEVA